MTLKDLKQGMICELRNGEEIVVVDNETYVIVYILLPFRMHYNNNLTHKEKNLLDIVKITYGDKVVFERKENRWFVPEVGERYYYLEDCGGIGLRINTRINRQYQVDIDILNNSRVFKTRKEAEKRLKQQQATLSVERWIAENDVEVDVNDTNVEKHYFNYDVETKEFKTGYHYHRVILPKQFILSSKEKANQLIKEREKELKIMFGVEE